MPDQAPAGSDARAFAILDGLSAIAHDYDGYIVDLWGVVHNGVEPYPGVVDCLIRMRGRGARVCLLSNAPRRIDSVVAKLRELGVPDAAYDGVLSSGEASHLALAEPPDAFHRGLGRRCFHLGPPRDADVYQGLDLALVDRPEEASFVLCTGVDDFDETLDDYAPVLDRCLAAGLPMICANPDIVVVVGDKLAVCAGAMAAYYVDRGGRATWHGKPHPPIYELLRRRYLADVPAARILAIGDSVHTDMAGAAAVGLDALFVMDGIHRDEIVRPGGSIPDPARLAALFPPDLPHPRAAMWQLVW